MNNKENSINYRYEKKFLLSGDTSSIAKKIKLHPSIFKEIFYERQINNIYFDTHGLKNYKDNINGLSNRCKIRIRWYGDTFGNIDFPVLEIKIKSGFIGYKISKKMPPFKIDKNSSRNDLSKLFNSFLKKHDLPIKSRLLTPTILNSYTRRYFMSADKKFRLTLDYNLSYFRINKNVYLFNNIIIDKKTKILELKYDDSHNSKAKNITDYFKLRTSAVSKYVNGIVSSEF